MYSLPAGYLATTGTTIQISQHNPIFEDIAAGLTASLPVNGSKGMTGALSIADGSAGSPSLRLGSALTTGWYKITGGWGFSAAGVSVFQITADYQLLPSGAVATRPGTPAAGMLRYNTDNGAPEFYNGTNWVGIAAGLSGSQMPYGGVINGTIVESHTGNAATYALKTLAGNDPSAADPVLLAFRNSTVGTGNYVYRTVTAALSLTISSGSTMGFTSAVAGKLWIVLFDDAGTIRMGAINCLSGSNVYPLGQMPIASSTAEGGVGAADSAQVFYTGTAVTSKPYLILGYAAYESGLGTAGSWASAPTRIHLYGAGVPLPGTIVQRASAQLTGTDSTTNTYTLSNTAPVAANGKAFASCAFAATSSANLIKIHGQVNGTASTSTATFLGFITSSSGPTTLTTTYVGTPPAGGITWMPAPMFYQGLAASVSSITYTGYFASNTGTAFINGTSSGAMLGGTSVSYIEVEEIMT